MISDTRVICLCAGWCGTCTAFEAIFDRLKATYDEVRFAWVDIEDAPDLVGNYDVETFPTILLGRGRELLFCGPTLPHYETISRMVRAGLDGSLHLPATPTVDPEAMRIFLSFCADEMPPTRNVDDYPRGRA